MHLWKSKSKEAHLCDGCKQSLGGYRDTAAIVASDDAPVAAVKSKLRMPKLSSNNWIKIGAPLLITVVVLALCKALLIVMAGILSLVVVAGIVYGITVGLYKLGNFVCKMFDWEGPKDEGPLTWFLGVATIALPILIYWAGVITIAFLTQRK